MKRKAIQQLGLVLFTCGGVFALFACRPIEADMGLILGLGFPTFRGGALRYIDSLGASEFCQIADKYSDLGPLYRPTEKLREMASAGAKFYQLQG